MSHKKDLAAKVQQIIKGDLVLLVYKDRANLIKREKPVRTKLGVFDYFSREKIYLESPHFLEPNGRILKRDIARSGSYVLFNPSKKYSTTYLVFVESEIIPFLKTQNDLKGYIPTIKTLQKPYFENHSVYQPLSVFEKVGRKRK